MRRNTLFILAAVALAILLGLGIMSQAGPIRAGGDSGANAVSAGTNITTWQSARNAYTTGYVSTDDTTPDPNGQTWTAALGSYHQLSSEYSTLSLSFYAYGDGTGDGDSNGGTFDANVYLVEPYGSWERVASITCAVGELELTHNPVTGAEINSGSIDPNESYKWVEGPFTDNLSDSDIWPTTVGLSGATNGIGRLNIDPLGAKGLIVLIDNMSGETRVYPVVKER
jgi:hypothetical protein